MRLALGQLRRLINESYLNGVPEWQFREDATGFVDDIRDRIKQFILINKSGSGGEQREAIAAMNAVCDELEQKVYDLVEEQLSAFMRRV